MSAQPAVRRPLLRLVGADPLPWLRFCGRCGEAAPAQDPFAGARVCPACGLGLMVGARADLAPRPADSFLIVDSFLTVQALSEPAETALAVREPQAVNRHVSELLMPGDAEVGADADLIVAIGQTISGEVATVRAVVRPRYTFGVRLLARIAACGPPQAALLVLDQPVRQPGPRADNVGPRTDNVRVPSRWR